MKPIYSLISDMSQNLSELSAKISETSISILNVTEYGVKGLVDTDPAQETAALQNVLNIAPENSVIYFPSGTYNITGVKVEAKSLFLYGPGATLVQSGNAPILNLIGGWDGPVNVTGIAFVEKNLDANAQNPSMVTVLTVNQPINGLMEGDIVRIFSDDLIYGSPPAAADGKAARAGEFGIVIHVEGNEVWLSNTLREKINAEGQTYKTNVRLAKLKNTTYQVNGFTCEADPKGDAANWNSELLRLEAVMNPNLTNNKCNNGYDSFIQFVGCFGASVTKCEARDLRNEPAKSQYGYGVNDFSSEGCRVLDCIFINVRHGYTANVSSIVAGSQEISYYGRTAHVNVSHCRAVGCSNSGFDTHDEAYDVVFDHCQASGSYRGNGAVGSGFQIRGKKIVLDHCIVENSEVGFNIYEFYENATSDIYLDHCFARAINTQSLQIKTVGDGNNIPNVHIENCYFESGNSYVTQFRNAEINMINTTFKPTGNSVKVLYFENTCSFQFNQLTVDLSLVNDDNTRIIKINGGETTVSGTTLDIVQNGTNKLRTFIEGDANLAQENAQDNNSVEITKINLARKPLYGPTNIGNYVLQYYGIEDHSSSAILAIQTSSAEYTLTGLQHVADERVYASINASNDVQIQKIPDGYRPGQILVIQNVSSSNYIVIVQHGDPVSSGGQATGETDYNTRLDRAQDQKLYKYESVALIWEGISWSQFN